MAFLPADQRELFLPLIEGISENPPWQSFMRNLLARTGGRRGVMIIVPANAPPGQEPTVLQFAAPRAADELPLDWQRLAQLNLHPYGQLRPDRVYALDEMLDFSDPARLATQREELHAMGIKYGRWLRIAAGSADCWIVLVREREDFSATAVVTLAAIAPLFASALRARLALAEQALHTAMADSALDRLGIGQLAFDRGGRVIAADAVATSLLPITDDLSGKPGRRLQVLPDTARQIDAACAAMADGTGDQPALVPLGGEGRFLLLRPAELALAPPGPAPVAIGTLRTEKWPDERAAIAMLRAAYALSAREAALAYRIALGQRIVEAGAALRLTPETSRNYSKRIYAKVGVSGQAELVRQLLDGLFPLA